MVRLIGWPEQPQTKRKELCSPPVGEEAEFADAHKTARQWVQQEAAQELIDSQNHDPLLVAVSGVAPAKGERSLLNRLRDLSLDLDGGLPFGWQVA